ncbi:MAG: LytTR family transcriptional regulator [Defluviitaleaceae bacterium]|nr:LytTR family transcriptional regulator [Defluviitaleaceae bacterium]
MKIIIQEPPQNEEESIIFNVRCISDNISRAINLIKSPDCLTVYINEEAFMLSVTDIFYVESVDLKTFVYAQKAVYRSKLKLYEIEEALSTGDFIRISKQVIVNVKKIKSVSPAGDSRFQAVLVNGERVIISRQYVPILKQRFGL